MGALLAADRAEVVQDGAVLLPATSLGIGAGECAAVLGPNGAGKTTLLRVMAGRLRPSGGAATLRGRPLDERRREARRELSVLIEPPALYPDLTLSEQLALIEASWIGETAAAGASADRADRDQPGEGDEDRAAALAPGFGGAALGVFGLAELGDRFPHELSSGQRQLVSLAVSFARPANALLLDEPEQRLDPHRRGLVAEAILAAKARGAAVLFASHDAELVERVADRRVRVGE